MTRRAVAAVRHIVELFQLGIAVRPGLGLSGNPCMPVAALLHRVAVAVTAVAQRGAWAALGPGVTAIAGLGLLERLLRLVAGLGPGASLAALDVLAVGAAAGAAVLAQAVIVAALHTLAVGLVETVAALAQRRVRTSRCFEGEAVGSIHG